jgi:hypothetical protein
MLPAAGGHALSGMTGSHWKIIQRLTIDGPDFPRSRSQKSTCIFLALFIIVQGKLC